MTTHDEQTQDTTPTYRQVRAAYSALVTLAQRTLPTITQDLKVAALVRKLKPIEEDLQHALQGKADLFTRADNATGLRVVSDQRGLEQAQEEAYSAAVPDFQWPTARITQEDLPKALKSGELRGKFVDGEQNREGLAAILVDLGPLFTWPDVTG